MIQEKLDSDPCNDELKKEEIGARKEALLLDLAEKDFLKQKAKCQHLNFADKNSKYFFSMIKKRNTTNGISFLCKENGEEIRDMEEIVSLFGDHYKDLFGTSITPDPIEWMAFGEGPRLQQGERDAMIVPVSDREIKNALWDIGNDKAPGPDGFSSAFFKKEWATVRVEVLGAVHEFFNYGLILRDLNHTVVTLIPKTTHNPTVGDFRPIACTNVIYKIITKILMNRMQSSLNNVIHSSQSAFVKGRSITDNIFLAQELIRKYERKRISPRCMLKIDLQKAYDSISWEFLEMVLVGIGFHHTFIQWIMTCVRSTTFTLAINGGHHHFIEGKRGLRQGDPMSPTLFLFCMEYLARLLQLRTKEREFNFHPKCENLKITHLAFADDLLVFGRGDRGSMEIIDDTLKEFAGASGLKINKRKSQIFIAGVKDMERKEIIDLFGFEVGTLPIKYLGIPLASKKLTAAQYEPLIKKISDSIYKWSDINLSMAGRLELARAVIQGAECYWLQIFPLPAEVIQRLNRIVRNFVWGKAAGQVAWKKVCLPKEEGGLALRDLGTWNKALLIKNLWNIHSKAESLWIHWIHTEYIKKKEIWTLQPHSTDSPLIKNICGVRDLLIQKHGNSIQNAQQAILAWKDTNLTVGAYECFRTKGEKSFWHKAIWRSFIPPRCSITLWLALQHRLKTVDRLVDVQKLCSICQKEDESHDHLFFKCENTKKVWDEIKEWMRLKELMSTIPSAIKHLTTKKKGSAIVTKAKLLAIAMTVNHVWFARNKLIFEKEPFVEGKVINEIKSDMFRCLYEIYLPEEVRAHLEWNGVSTRWK